MFNEYPPHITKFPTEMSACPCCNTVNTLKYRSADEVMSILIEYLKGMMERKDNYYFAKVENCKEYYSDLLTWVYYDILGDVDITENVIQDAWYTVKAFVTYNCCDFTNDTEFIEEFNKKNPKLARKYHIMYDRVAILVNDCTLLGGAIKFKDITIDLPELINV